MSLVWTPAPLTAVGLNLGVPQLPALWWVPTSWNTMEMK
jgi:hypothetical protein